MPDDTHSTGVKRVKVLVPIPMDGAGVANRAQQLPPEFVAPGFQPEFAAVPWGAALGDSYHDMLLMDWTVFQAGIAAEDEGYAGLRALRSRLTIPVVGPGEAAFATAMMLGKKFTVLTMWPQWFPLYEKNLTEYGWWSRCSSLRSINTRPDATELLAGKEEAIFSKLKAEAERAISEDGAEQALASPVVAGGATPVGAGSLTLRFGTIAGAAFTEDTAQAPATITIPSGATLADVAAAIAGSGSGVPQPTGNLVRIAQTDRRFRGWSSRLIPTCGDPDL